MFKKIRNRILLLNMAMVSAVIIIAFAFLYASAYTRVQMGNLDKLTGASRPLNVTTTFVGVEGEYAISAAPAGESVLISGLARRAAPGESLYFSVIVDEQTNVVEIDSLVELPEYAYEAAATQALLYSGAPSTISLEGRVWQYAVDSTAVMSGGGTGYSSIRFVDVTESHEMVRSLALMLLGLMTVVLVAVFFISLHFANRAVRPMELAWERQGRFVADASHELKTPISIISANCAALYAAPGESVQSQIKWVDSIMRAADRMAGLTRGLLSLAELEDSREREREQTVDVSAAARECVAEIEAAAADKSISVAVEIEPRIEADDGGGRVRQIFGILLDNAVKYTPSGGEISVSLRRAKRGAVFAVRNSGEGISERDLKHVFDRFYRADPSRARGSSGANSFGLGLAIAQSAAAAIGAQLSAESEQGEYARFSLRLRVK